MPSAAWSRLRKFIAPLAVQEDEYAPYATQAMRIANQGDAPVNLLIESEVLDRPTGDPLLAFAPPRWKSPRQSATSEFLLRVAGHDAATALMSVYAQRDTPAGDYIRRFRIYLVGSHEPLAELTAPLRITRGSRAASIVLVGSLVGAIAVWGGLAISVRRLARQLGLEHLTTIALMAGFYFAISYAARIGGDLLAARDRAV